MLTDGIGKIVFSILLFPTLFQEPFITFAWGRGDVFWIMAGKRLFLILPTLAIILGCWISIACVLSVLIRQNRKDFIIAMVITWWDLGKSIVSFWGGIFKFVFNLSASLLGLLKVFILGIWFLIQEIIFMPFRLIRGIGKNIISSQIPWIAVILTLFWCLIEATIFTYVTSPLVIDTFSNITGEQLAENFIRIPLFVFMLFIVLGSYAVLSTFVDSIKEKKFSNMLGIGAIEIIVLLVEVVFLYREFVDSLVPWFAQYSENFELGIFWTLAISIFTWFGIRSLSWFLFASHGTPTIMAVIQGKGLAVSSSREVSYSKPVPFSNDFMNKIKEDTNWIQTKGDELLASFMLPPLQVIAAAINFCILLVSGNHLFELPFKNISDITNSKILLDKIAIRKESLKEA